MELSSCQSKKEVDKLIELIIKISSLFLWKTNRRQIESKSFKKSRKHL